MYVDVLTGIGAQLLRVEILFKKQTLIRTHTHTHTSVKRVPVVRNIITVLMATEKHNKANLLSCSFFPRNSGHEFCNFWGNTLCIGHT